MALSALSFKSFNPVLISPDGVTIKPKYLYSRTVLMLFSPYEKCLLSKRPVLLNIIHWVLSVFIVNLFISAYVFRATSIFLRPVSVSDSIKRSSAHIKLLICFSSDILTGVFISLFNALGRSAKKILKRSGLNTQPCLTPWLILKEFVIYPPIFTQPLSFRYMFSIVL